MIIRVYLGLGASQFLRNSKAMAISILEKQKVLSTTYKQVKIPNHMGQRKSIFMIKKSSKWPQQSISITPS